MGTLEESSGERNTTNIRIGWTSKNLRRLLELCVSKCLQTDYNILSVEGPNMVLVCVTGTWSVVGS